MKILTAYAIIWLATASAVIAGMIITGDLTALWALLIPLFVSIKEE